MSQSFHYLAADQNGVRTQGEINAANKEEIANILKKRNLIVLSIESVKPSSGFFAPRSKSIGLKEKILLTSYIATMIKAGSPLIGGIDVLLSDAKDKNFIALLQEIKAGLERGELLGDLLSRHPQSFDNSFVAVVRAGEQSGQLEEVMGGLAQKLRKDQEMIGKVRTALAYPAIILSALFLVGILMIVFILPKLMASFTDLSVKLPPLTKALVALSNFTSRSPLLFIFASLVIVAGAIFFVRSALAKKTLAALGGIFPLTRALFKALDMARLTSILAILLKTGVPVERSLAVTSDVVYNPRLKKILSESVAKISQGKSIADSLREEKSAIPEIMIKVIQMGEETGYLAQSLETLAESFNQEVNNRLQALSVVIEPVLMLIVGVVVGGFVYSIIGPIYQVVGQAGR